jgi:hypothetical protein
MDKEKQVTITLPLQDWHLLLRIVSFAKRWELVSTTERARLTKIETYIRQLNLPL